jgi:hypothetical protein
MDSISGYMKCKGAERLTAHAPLDGCGLYQMRRPEFAKAPMSRNTPMTMAV